MLFFFLNISHICYPVFYCLWDPSAASFFLPPLYWKVKSKNAYPTHCLCWMGSLTNKLSCDPSGPKLLWQSSPLLWGYLNLRHIDGYVVVYSWSCTEKAEVTTRRMEALLGKQKMGKQKLRVIQTYWVYRTEGKVIGWNEKQREEWNYQNGWEQTLAVEEATK